MKGFIIVDCLKPGAPGTEMMSSILISFHQEPAHLSRGVPAVYDFRWWVIVKVQTPGVLNEERTERHPFFGYQHGWNGQGNLSCFHS